MSSLAHREEIEGEAMSGKWGAWLSRNRLWVGKAVGFGVMRCTRIKFHQQPSLRQL